MTKKETNALALLIMIGLPIWLTYEVFKFLGAYTFFAILILIPGIFYYMDISAKKKRKAWLLDKYKDPWIVEKIMSRQFWINQTLEQLKDSLGLPDDIDEKVYKTKTKYTYKYGHQSGNRYNLRIIVENEIVVGWDDKR
tara:strand:- start:131 stop:547 length:417 start_codon:yes stop_codon:yes gene_type:complete